MPALMLTPGPKLLHRPDSGPEYADVSALAHRFLFTVVDIKEGVTLGDVMGLFEACPPLCDIFHRDYAVELLDEARKGYLPADPAQAENHQQTIEYLEVYNDWRLDTSTQTYLPVHHLQFHGVGPILKEDAPDHYRKAGERIQWGISGASLRSMLMLPVRVNLDIAVSEADRAARAHGGEIARVHLDGVSLGQVLHAIVWELSFHGAPAEAQSVMQGLKEQLADIEAGTAELSSADDFFDELDQPACAHLFDTIGTHSPREVWFQLSTLEDHENAAQGLTRILGDEVKVKTAFLGLDARAFRRVFQSVTTSGGIEDP